MPRPKRPGALCRRRHENFGRTGYCVRSANFRIRIKERPLQMKLHLRYSVACTARAGGLPLSPVRPAPAAHAAQPEYTIKLDAAGRPAAAVGGRPCRTFPDTGFRMAPARDQRPLRCRLRPRAGISIRRSRRRNGRCSSLGRGKDQVDDADRARAHEVVRELPAARCPAIWLQNPYTTFMVHKPEDAGATLRGAEQLAGHPPRRTDRSRSIPSRCFTATSTARWEGDTLVVESIGFDDRIYIHAQRLVPQRRTAGDRAL